MFGAAHTKYVHFVVDVKRLNHQRRMCLKRDNLSFRQRKTHFNNINNACSTNCITQFTTIYFVVAFNKDTPDGRGGPANWAQWLTANRRSWRRQRRHPEELPRVGCWWWWGGWWMMWWWWHWRWLDWCRCCSMFGFRWAVVRIVVGVVGWWWLQVVTSGRTGNSVPIWERPGWQSVWTA